MYSQIISAESLYALMTQKERRHCSIIGRSKEEVISDIQTRCVDKVYDNSYSFKLTMRGNLCINAHPIESVEHLCQDLLVRKLSANVMRTYRLKPTNRNLIIRQIKQLLESGMPVCIMRKDVRHFYESVDPEIILSELRKNGRVTLQTLQLCKELIAAVKAQGVNGMPRGLAISSAMTEFLMRKFDHAFIKLPEMLLYSRYVDDIILICTSHCDISKVQTIVDESLSAVNLQENKEKQYSLKSENWLRGDKFEFLGYSFQYLDKKVSVCIADKKLNRIKTKISRAFKDFTKTGDEQMLYDRMQFLACISYVKSSSLRKIKVGLPANYSATSSNESFKQIDKYYQNILHCRSASFGGDLQKKLSSFYREKLKRISFSHCYDYHIKRKFSIIRIRKLKDCWR